MLLTGSKVEDSRGVVRVNKEFCRVNYTIFSTELYRLVFTSDGVGVGVLVGVVRALMT